MASENIEGFAPQEESIDIKAIFMKMAKYWYLYALTIFVAVTVAFLFNKYTNPVFEVSTPLFVESEKDAPMNPGAMIGLGMMSTANNVENEIGKFSSFSLTYRTVKSLDFEVSYFVNEGLISRELYKKSPFEVVFDTAVPQAVGLKYTLKFINKNEFLLEAEGELITKYDFSKAKKADGFFEKVYYSKTFRFIS